MFSNLFICASKIGASTLKNVPIFDLIGLYPPNKSYIKLKLRERFINFSFS